MRGGDDRLFFTGGQFLGPLSVDLGFGNDSAEIGRDGLRLERGLDVQLGDGQDIYRQNNVRVQQNLSIDGGAGGDSIAIRLSSVGGTLNGEWRPVDLMHSRQRTGSRSDGIWGPEGMRQTIFGSPGMQPGV